MNVEAMVLVLQESNMIYFLLYLTCGVIVACLSDVEVEADNEDIQFLLSLVIYFGIVLLFPLFCLFLLYMDFTEDV